MLLANSDLLTIVSADYGRVVFTQDLKAVGITLQETDQLTVFANTNNPSNSVNGVIFSAIDSTLISFRLVLANATHQEFTILGKKMLDFEPHSILSIK